MLPREQRVSRSGEHRAVVRVGRSARRGSIVVHALGGQPGPARAGLVVGKRVGGAVQRNTLKRRLRHLLQPWLDVLPAGTLLVVRVRPEADGASSTELSRWLDSALRRLGLGASPGTP